MKTLKIESYEEHTVILERDTDYKTDDLIPGRFNPTLNELTADKVQEIAVKNGFEKWSFASHEGTHGYDGIMVRLIKNLKQLPLENSGAEENAC